MLIHPSVASRRYRSACPDSVFTFSGIRNEGACQRVVRLAEGIGNDTPVHAALLLYKARALRGLGLLVAARDTLTLALRRKKGRSEDLLRALRYERALVYEALGQHRRARSEFEKLYAEAPDHEDVAVRLGIAAGARRGPSPTDPTKRYRLSEGEL